MLPPYFFDENINEYMKLVDDLDHKILRDIVRRICKTGKVTDTAKWQAERLQQSGFLFDDLISGVASFTGKSDKAIKSMFKKAGVESLKWDNSIYKKVGFIPLPIQQSPALLSVLGAGLQKTKGVVNNLTLTTANMGQQAYIQACNNAYMELVSGAFDYNTILRNAVKYSIDESGRVSYPSGHVDKLDVALRRSLLTGANQTTAKLQEAHADEMGCDLVETTAHAGARPAHAIWQGKVYSRSGASDKYLPFSETGYGTGAGLCGWNCRHSFYPFFEGLSESAYPREQLKEYESREVTYNGGKMTYYEATQQQRSIERKIRNTRRELVGYDEAIKNGVDFQNEFNTTSVKLKKQEALLKDFCKQTGIGVQSNRNQVLKFNRSVSQKAVWANRNELEKYQKIRYNKDGTIIVTDDWKDKEHPRVRKSYKSNAVIDTVSRKGEQFDRTVYDSQRKMRLQIHSGDHANPKKHPFGKSGEHKHIYTWNEDGTLKSKITAELTETDRIQNADILGGVKNDRKRF